ncbi:unnamed protein product, partial [marine sediment metagenome]
MMAIVVFPTERKGSGDISFMMEVARALHQSPDIADEVVFVVDDQQKKDSIVKQFPHTQFRLLTAKQFENAVQPNKEG